MTVHSSFTYAIDGQTDPILLDAERVSQYRL